jgi:hypothetical protein
MVVLSSGPKAFEVVSVEEGEGGGVREGEDMLKFVRI